MARKSLDDILDGNDEPETEVQAEAQAPEPERQEPEKGVEPDQQEEPAEPEAEPPSEEKTVPLAAKQDEVRKRQAAERERDEIRVRLETLEKENQQRQQPKDETPPPSIWDDDKAALAYERQQAVAESLAASSYQTKLQTSEFYARKNIEGFSDDWEPMNKWLQENPTVAQQAAQDFDPWDYAHRAYRNQQTMQELGATDMATLKQQMREELLAELQAEPPKAVPTSLSQKRSVGSRSGPAWSGPTPLSDLLD